MIYTNDINGDSSPGGEFAKDIAVVASQFERKQISARTAEKYLASLKKGLRPGGPVPVGYLRGGRAGIIVPDPEGSKHVKKIFELFEAGEKPSEIAVYMMKHYGRTPTKYSNASGREYASHLYTENIIRHILGNPIYAGYVFLRLGKNEDGEEEYELFDGIHEALVDRDVWERCRLKLSVKKKVKLRGLTENDKFLFKKKLFCSCGSCMSTGGSGKIRKRKEEGDYLYYVCTRKNHERGMCDCKTSIAQTSLEDIILVALAEFASGRLKKSDLKELKNNAYENKLKEERKSLISKQTRLTNSISKNLALLKEFNIKSSVIKDIKQEVEDLAVQRDTCEERLEAVNYDLKLCETKSITSFQVGKIFSNLEKICDSLKMEEKKEIVNTCIEKAVLSCESLSKNVSKSFSIIIFTKGDLADTLPRLELLFEVYTNSRSKKRWKITDPFKYIGYSLGRLLSEDCKLQPTVHHHFLYDVIKWSAMLEKKKMTLTELSREVKCHKSVISRKVSLCKKLSGESLKFIAFNNNIETF